MQSFIVRIPVKARDCDRPAPSLPSRPGQDDRLDGFRRDAEALQGFDRMLQDVVPELPTSSQPSGP
ncbi:hypothetical protein ACUSIJ_23245 [Pseudochelatococcus sp. B33]